MVNKNNIYFPLSTLSVSDANDIKEWITQHDPISKNEKGAANGVAALNANGKLQSSQLDTSSDSYKIKLVNLAEEVQSAMAGTAPVISSVADDSLTTEKYSNQSITYNKLDGKLQEVLNCNFIDPTNFEDGYYYNILTGVKTEYSGVSCVSNIPVIAGKTYTIAKHGLYPLWFNHLVVFYKSDGTFVSGVNPYGDPNDYKTFTVPSTAAYCNITVSTANKSMVLMYEGPYDSTKTVANTNKIALDWIPNLNLLSNWNGKKFTSFGDSITSGNKWQPHVVNTFGLIHTTCGQGSTTIAGNADSEVPCMWEDVRLNAVKDSDPDVLTIMGGANDIWRGNLIGDDSQFTVSLQNKDKTKFKGAYSYIIETLLTWKPTLRIFIMTNTYGQDSYWSNATTGLKWTNYAQATRDVANYYSLPIIDLAYEVGFNKLTKSTLMSDSIHPNEAGGKRIAELVIASFSKLHPID